MNGSSLRSDRFASVTTSRILVLSILSISFQNPAILTVPGGASVACSTAKAIEWDAAWSNHLDPSGRAALGVHDSAYELNVGPNPSATKIGEDGTVIMDTKVPELAIQS